MTGKPGAAAAGSSSDASAERTTGSAADVVDGLERQIVDVDAAAEAAERPREPGADRAGDVDGAPEPPD